MAFDETPHVAMLPSELRCEAMTSGHNSGWQKWCKEPHRCVKRAIATRDGKSVCHVHNAAKRIRYWQGGEDSFPWRVQLNRNREKRESKLEQR